MPGVAAPLSYILFRSFKNSKASIYASILSITFWITSPP